VLKVCDDIKAPLMKRLLSLAVGIVLGIGSASAQCNPGEVEVYIDVITDAYGYECYWELLPNGDACGGTGTIFSGGNGAVGCNGAAAQNQTPGGYGDNLTITEGPWCLTEGAFYDIEWIDDWGDDGLSFDVRVNGFTAYQFVGSGAGNVFTFEAADPSPYDVGVQAITMDRYVNAGAVDVKAKVKNFGTATLTDLDLVYTIDGGAAVTGTVTGLSLAPFEETTITHTVSWAASVNGSHTVQVTSGNINGSNADMNAANNVKSEDVIVGPGRDNVIDQYQILTPTFTVVADGSDGVAIPRDLEFHPNLPEKELWVLNKGTENSGGSTVTIWDAGEGSQTAALKSDGNAWHFMSLPTALAFSNNWNFGTAQGVWDANHQAGPTDDPFTGPSLWSSDPAIYAQPSGGNGSHLDMLHSSPYCQGMAHENDNAFWIFDGHSNDIVRYDFVDDHGPGNDDHSDAVVRRYLDFSVTKDPNDHISSHMVLDKATNWLYIVDHGNDRVMRIDITTGTVSGASPAYGPFEPMAEYSVVTGYAYEEVISSGLVEPSGIAIMEDRLLVSDHSNGDIIVYDVNTDPMVEMFRIQTGAAGIMGLEIGPNGHIWYVNATTNQVVRIDAVGLSVCDDCVEETTVSLYPNPATDVVHITSSQDLSNATVEVYDLAGKLVVQDRFSTTHSAQLNTSQLAPGVYSVVVRHAKVIETQTLVVQ
jgi:hypothetical protein